MSNHLPGLLCRCIIDKEIVNGNQEDYTKAFNKEFNNLTQIARKMTQGYNGHIDNKVNDLVNGDVEIILFIPEKTDLQS